MQKLRNAIQDGWIVHITDHDYLDDSRDAVVENVTSSGMTLRLSKPWTSQGRKFPTMEFSWDGDRSVEGTTVRLYHTPPRHTGKSRRLIKTFEFTPPVAR
ncbi:hypothetical protein ACIQVR_27160 [Streptomyces xanthochromogenes]|uniref:hypothetical protein n=1 Tax=Streptomyces xanthochromogenes TaxID=67384 RepID=UPI00381F64D8